MGNDILLCEVCSTAAAAVVHASYETKYGQVPIFLESVEMIRCKECGEEYFTPEQARSLSKRVKAAAREKLGLLSPERIVEIRRKKKLSQERLEWLLNLGSKVVTRWENDRVLQTRSADDLLRLIERVPNVVEELVALRKGAGSST